jgi:translin
MLDLEAIAERIHESMEARTATRDQALSQARTLTRYCAHAIRAVHREEWPLAQEQLAEARSRAKQLCDNLQDYPELYFSGYTQDALKEFTEASIVYALVKGEPLPSPEALEVEYATYLKGLAESAGELRRRCLDILREGYSKDTETLLSYMDDIYDLLITMDYPDAITYGLRRLTDIVRAINERTRGDITVSLREEHLERSLRSLEARLNQ